MDAKYGMETFKDFLGRIEIPMPDEEIVDPQKEGESYPRFSWAAYLDKKIDSTTNLDHGK